ncbi:MAG: hypothetical protein MJ252_16840 [archaeon]|nr:hypothetical protein [archaeon]
MDKYKIKTKPYEPPTDGTCWLCKKNKITFCCLPCHCEILCFNCAKKVSTGGKCRKCREMICQCKRICKD